MTETLQTVISFLTRGTLENEKKRQQIQSAPQEIYFLYLVTVYTVQYLMP